jgi:hypothetical protein
MWTTTTAASIVTQKAVVIPILSQHSSNDEMSERIYQLIRSFDE